jgi:hypothetical protein
MTLSFIRTCVDLTLELAQLALMCRILTSLWPYTR